MANLLDPLRAALADRGTVERVGDSAAEAAARRLRRRALKGNPLGVVYDASQSAEPTLQRRDTGT